MQPQKNDESVSFVGTWMDLEIIILSKLTQEQKIKHVLHVLTHRWVMNNENRWTQGWEHHTLGSAGGVQGRDSGGDIDIGEG